MRPAGQIRHLRTGIGKRQTVVYQFLLEVHCRTPDKVRAGFSCRNLALEPFIAPCPVIVRVVEFDKGISAMEGRKQVSNSAIGVYDTVNDESFFFFCRCDDISVRVSVAVCTPKAQANCQKQCKRTKSPQSTLPYDPARSSHAPAITLISYSAAIATLLIAPQANGVRATTASITEKRACISAGFTVSV